MIDIHTHILFDVDDGCNTIEESLKLLKQAELHGVTDLIFTPHCSERRGYELNEKKLLTNFQKLRDLAKKETVKINLYLGMEIDDERSMLKRINNGAFRTLNNTNYILLDFGYSNIDIDEILYEVIIKGYIPVVAHPERYRNKDIDLIKKWKQTGALIQLDSDSLFDDKQTKKAFKEIIRLELADFVASDSHGQLDSYSNFKKAFEYVSKKNSKEYASLLFKGNAKKLLLKKA